MLSQGFFLIINEPERALNLKTHIESERVFSEALSIVDLKARGKTICFISLDQKNLSYIAIAEKCKRVVTYKAKYEFRRVIKIQDLDIQEIANMLNDKTRKYFINSATGSGRLIPEGTWNSFLSLLEKNYPDVYKTLLDYEQYLKYFYKSYDNSIYETIAEEKDALSIALEIFAANRKDYIHLYKTDPATIAPFLKGINMFESNEDSMIIHDSKVFGNWKHDKDIPIRGGAVFTKPGNRLTVLNANRNDLEHTFGVDLIYYNHYYDSFVLVQYKRMRKEESNKYIYRPASDGSFFVEFNKMKDFLKEDPHSPAVLMDYTGYRVLNNPFFYKFCNSINPSPLSEDLIPGMYLPLDYLDILLNSDKSLGKKGGRIITYENAGRWFSNTEFISIVQDGWVGSDKKTSAKISQLVNDLLDASHSVTVAEAYN